MGRGIFITVEEARKLKPIFENLREIAPWKDAKESASRILMELRHIKDIDYSPFPGQQVFLSPVDYRFYLDVLNNYEIEDD